MLTFNHIITLSSIICIYIFITSITIAICSETAAKHVDYCSLKCKDLFTGNVNENSGCDCSEGSSCGSELQVFTPTTEERQMIVSMHNGFRERVANGSEARGQNKGGATDINALSYDDSLEYVAECWAKKCISRHDECRRTQNFSRVGQNFYTTTGQKCDNTAFVKAVDMWYEEISGITLGCVLGYGACMAVSHYTQLLWAKTTHVGCARVEHSAKTCNVFCNYGPSGNIYGEAIYTIGPPGIHCSARDKVYRSLCASRKSMERADNNISSKPSNCFILIFLITSISISYHQYTTIDNK